MVRTKQRGVPNLGERITSLMETEHLNASELSARTGISVSYLTRIIKGEVVNPTADFLIRIAAGLGVTESELLREDEKDKDTGKKKKVPFAAGAMHFPQPRRMEMERVIQELIGVLSRAEEYKDGCQETLKLLESFVEWLKFRLEEPLSFAQRLYLQITGPASDVQSIFDEVEAGKHPGLKVAIAPRESSSLFSGHTHGYEARLYGTVEFTAHVAEQIAQNYIKDLIENKFPQSRIEVKLSKDAPSP